MKKLIFLIALVSGFVRAQTPDLKNPWIFSAANGNAIPFFNESGTQVYQCRAGDTVVSAVIPFYYDDIRASIRLQSGDSAHWSVYYQFINGKPNTDNSDAARNEGFYASGSEAVSALIDSINIVGAVPVGAKTGANLYFTDDNMITKSSTSTHQIYMRTNGATGVAVSDSVVSYTSTSADARLGYYGVRIVVIGQVNDEHEGTGSTSNLLNKWVVHVSRKKQ